MKKAYNIFTSILLWVLVAIVGILFIPSLMGLTPLAVLSGSMEPTYHVGSVVFVKEEAPESITVGEPITYKLTENTMVTHRVIAIDPTNQTFITKGDANDAEDAAPVSWANLVGVPVFSVPLLGYLAVFASSTKGMIILVTIIIALLILTFVPDMFKDKDDKENSDGKQSEQKQPERQDSEQQTKK